MKQKLLLALLLLGFTVNAQLGLNIGTDLKVLLFETDNQYTTHQPTFNLEVYRTVLLDMVQQLN